MKRQKKNTILISMILIGMLLLQEGCSLIESPQLNDSSVESQENVDANTIENGVGGFIVAGPNSYDSEDTAVLVAKNTEENTVTLFNLNVGKQYTLEIHGATSFYDKYGETVSLEQIDLGEIVDVRFLRTKKRLTSMQVSSKAWTNENVSKYNLESKRNDIIIGTDTYKVTEDTFIFSEGEQIERMDINPSDILTFHGIGTSILSITVEKGHGYLRLANAESFIGGFIEVGQSNIFKIVEDMLMTVPEGEYQVSISYNGSSGVKELSVGRNEEVTLDIGDIEVSQPKYGSVIFSLTPTTTTLYVDGTLIDASAPVTLKYGIHQLIAQATGYTSITSYIKVGQESAGIDITLDEESTTDSEDTDSSDTEEEDSDTDAEDTSQVDTDDESTDTTTTTSYYQVYIDSPLEAEIYLDGNYIGIAPVSFKKSSGSHVITIRKSGYETRSYTVDIDTEDKDISYSFADLIENE